MTNSNRCFSVYICSQIFPGIQYCYVCFPTPLWNGANHTDGNWSKQELFLLLVTRSKETNHWTTKAEK